MYLPTDPNFQQVAGITPQTCSLPYLPRDCEDETCQRPQTSLQADHDVVESSLDASNGAPDDSEDVRVTKHCPVMNEPGLSNEAEQGEKTCSAMENAEHVIDISTSVVGNSQDSITKCDDNKNGDLHSSGQETPSIPLQQVSDAVDDEAACDDGQSIDGMAPDICEEQAPKRRRLMPLQCRSEGIVTESDL
ncbi:ubiquitin-specific protease 2B isoform X2 [Spatholobus suberectus]|nr:ubiquitin-specific protease 2B isoform X2 [Spatholobus suberectus]